MEIVYRQTSEYNRSRQRRTKEQKVERRRGVQLAISLILFLLVFFGRGAFPNLAKNLGELLSNSADFEAMFSRFGTGEDNQEHTLSVVRRFMDSIAGDQSKETVSAERTDSVKIDAVEPALLSRTDQFGLQYLREFGIKPYTNPKEVENTATEESAMVVTAVAQAYNATGEVLPVNVSYEYYELGLNHTVNPVEGEMTSGFGYRISPITGKREFHLAIDVAADVGTEILAFADGVVRYIGESDDFGLYFMIDHNNGVATFYAHCSKLLIHKGDTVSCGQVVALVGETGKTTGPHLHFTIEKDKIRLDPSQYVAM